MKTEYISLNVVFIILLLYHLKSMMETVTIDKDGVSVKNWLTTERRKYSFDQFGSVVTHVDPIETFGRLDIYLLKDQVIFCRIRGSNYANLDELVSEIEKHKTKSNVEN